MESGIISSGGTFMTTPRIEAVGLRKEFGHIVAVDDISFSVETGEVLGFLGPNGAGKTTTMRMLTGYLRPTRGSVSICGTSMLAEPVSAKARIGYLPEGAPLYPELTPATFLRFTGMVRGLGGDALDKRISETAELVHLKEVWNQSVETLSKGYKRRLGLAQAILHDPDVLILDEPTDGLDPNQKREVRQLVRQMALSKAIIISTHILEEVHAVCTRAVILARGRIVADGTPEELESMASDHNAVSVLLPSDSAARFAETLEGSAAVRTVEVTTEGDDRSLVQVFPARDGRVLTLVTDLIREQDISVLELKQESGRLEEVFRNLTILEDGTTNGGQA
jgi:ABC-2 type transport system ATP-binding protein